MLLRLCRRRSSSGQTVWLGAGRARLEQVLPVCSHVIVAPVCQWEGHWALWNLGGEMKHGNKKKLLHYCISKSLDKQKNRMIWIPSCALLVHVTFSSSVVWSTWLSVNVSGLHVFTDSDREVGFSWNSSLRRTKWTASSEAKWRLWVLVPC